MATKQRVKRRAYCRECGAHKFTKFLEKVPSNRFAGVMAWRCRNREKCDGRGANYRK